MELEPSNGLLPPEFLLEFLVLCETSGLIDFKVPLEELREKLSSLWVETAPLASPLTSANELSQTCSIQDDSCSDLFDLKTPEIASTPATSQGGPTLGESSTGAHCHSISISESPGEGSEVYQTEGGSCSPRGGSLHSPPSGERRDDISGTSGSYVTADEAHENVTENPNDLLTLEEDHSSDSIGDLEQSDLPPPLPKFSLDCSLGTEDLTANTEDVTVAVCENVLDNGAGSAGLMQERERGVGAVEEDDNTRMNDSSDEDEADEKLEKLFADLRIQSVKKQAPKHIPSRKSLEVFIVSDSEDIGSDCEEQKENLPPPQTPHTLLAPSHCTPHTPYTGVVFWDSPFSLDQILVPKHGILTEKKRPFTTPRCLTSKPTPLTTPSANKYFPRFKSEMVRELFELFSSTVFENKLPADIEVKWNNKLRTTAGYCYYLGFGRDRSARIELSTKVCDSYDRIRHTLLHEMCHAATWIIDRTKGGHGSHWKAWARRANEVHPHLSPVTRCHNFEIAYKHTYKCTLCDFQIGRHSKSVNLKTTRCPYCFSTLELQPRLKADGTPAVNKLNRYAQFVKDNYTAIKTQSPWRNHKEVMEKLKKQYHGLKSAPVLDGSFSD